MAKSIYRCIINFASVAVVGLCLWSNQASAQLDPVRTQILSDRSTVRPGESFYLGVSFKIAPGWHIYWRNPGDAGIATSVEWIFPDGVRAGPLLWPPPQMFTEGDLATYGYSDQLLILSEVSIPENFQQGTLQIKAMVKWLGCEKMCLPGKAEVNIKIPVTGAGGENQSKDYQTIRAALQRLPKVIEAPLIGHKTSNELILFLPETLRQAKISAFYPFSDNLINHRALQSLNDMPNRALVSVLSESGKSITDNEVVGILIEAGSEIPTAYEVKIHIENLKTETPIGGHFKIPVKVFFLILLGGAGMVIAFLRFKKSK